MKSKILLLCFLVVGNLSARGQKIYELVSPDQQLKVEVKADTNLEISLTHGGTEVLAPSTISMTLDDGEVLGRTPKVSKVTKGSVDKIIPSPFYVKDEVKDSYNEMKINFQGNYSLIVRLYDDGMAYRFETRKKGEIVVVSEEADYRFSSDKKMYASYVNSSEPTFEEQFFNSFENPYVYDNITRQDDKRLKILPVLVELDNGKKLCITEADLEDYPGMFLNNTTGKPSLYGIHAPYPKTKEQGGHNNLQMLVTERENYIAKTKGTRLFPWRTFIVSKEDKELADSDMVYRLASPSRISDISWIKPGKVAWEWWNDWNLYGVDFRTGINNETYKYYIDFAAQHNIEYIILDEGWAVHGDADLLKVIPEIDIKGLVDYGKSKNVDIILWAGYWAFDRDLENVVKHYSDMGVKGFKVDFMDRDDQEMVNFLYRSAEVCGKYQMLLDFHGVFKPTGLLRTYPNVLNYEGVNGLEQHKWSPESYDMVTYDVSIPFIRAVAGPMDYTQGAMRNASRTNYRPVYSEPMSQGTRCRQLATYVIFESPINMLCDSPSNYNNEEECTEFIAAIPTVWDETVVLDGVVAEKVVIARRSGSTWYVGGLTNWDERDMQIDLSFLEDGNYRMELFKDGINADRAARDYKKVVTSVPDNRKLDVHLAPGGGFAAKITKQ